MGELERYGLLALLALSVLAVGYLLEEVRGLDGDGGPYGLKAVRTATAAPQEVVPVTDTVDTSSAPALARAVARAARPASSSRAESGSEHFNFFEPPVRLPGEEPTEPTPDGERVVLLQKNETLGQIAERELGAAHRWREILAINDGLDPRRILPGTAIRIPVVSEQVAPTLASAEAEGQRRYLVKSGDNFEGIAQRVYRDRTRWTEIYEANRDRCAGPTMLRAGIEIIIP